jgi:uncharacterized membrane protein HdeD (DUF308 family)
MIVYDRYRTKKNPQKWHGLLHGLIVMGCICVLLLVELSRYEVGTEWSVVVLLGIFAIMYGIVYRMFVKKEYCSWCMFDFLILVAVLLYLAYAYCAYSLIL